MALPAVRRSAWLGKAEAAGAGFRMDAIAGPFTGGRLSLRGVDLITDMMLLGYFSALWNGTRWNPVTGLVYVKVDIS